MCGDFNYVIVMLKKTMPVHKKTNNLHSKNIASGIIHSL